jgi:predicted Rossmann fold flavoprotein
MMNRYDAVIIGAGASGLMCAITAAKRGKNVIVIEKNKLPAKKLRITGKGRCNITNSAPMQEFISNTKTNGAFLYSAFYSFTNDDVISFFNSLGIKTKIERGGRVFPMSDSAHEVADFLVSYAKSCGAVFITDTVRNVAIKDKKVCGVVLSDDKILYSDSVVVATGGISYPATGSTGDGYAFAAEAGHKIIPAKPSLVPLTVKENWASALMGLSLKNIEIKLICGNKLIYNDFGEMLFTHFGVSGPVILSASAHIKSFSKTVDLFIDLKPALTAQQLDLRIVRDFNAYANKNFSNSLDDLLPKKLIPVIIELCDIPPYKKVNQITKQERASLVNILKGLHLTVTGTRPISEAIVTSGGVCTDEINPSTMESKLVGGLFFAGEVIDVDAYTGGYNLQIAFSTGFLAGEHI